MSRSCIDCGASITRWSTGRCRTCAGRRAGSDPDGKRRRGEKIKALHQDPAFHERHRQSVIASRARLKNDPVYMEQMRANGLRCGPANIRKAHTPEAREKGRDKKLAWCPDAYRPLNDELFRLKVPLPDRKAMIAEQMAVDERKRVAAMTPEQRQMERLIKAGGKLREVRPIARAQHDFTLGGVASGLL